MGHIAGSDILRGSLWIRPTGPALEQLQHAVRQIQDRVGGPGAMPHLTLLNRIEMDRLDAERRLKLLAASFMPFTIRLGRIDWTNEYYRAFFVRAEATVELLAARRRAEEIYEMNPHDPYEPHVSLYYGELDDATRKSLAAELGGGLDLQFEATSVQLNNSRAGLPMDQWRTVLECPFVFVGGAVGPDRLRA